MVEQADTAGREYEEKDVEEVIVVPTTPVKAPKKKRNRTNKNAKKAEQKLAEVQADIEQSKKDTAAAAAKVDQPSAAPVKTEAPKRSSAPTRDSDDDWTVVE